MWNVRQEYATAVKKEMNDDVYDHKKETLLTLYLTFFVNAPDSSNMPEKIRGLSFKKMCKC